MTLLIERSTNIKAYHGSNSVFDKFDQNKSRIINDFYGGGVAYFTDNTKVAITYAQSMSRKSGKPIVYEVNLNFKKLFDVDDTFTGKELIKFVETYDAELFARGAGLMGPRDDKYLVVAKLKKGDYKLSGEQVFRGLSRGMNQTAKAREILIKLGYDGLRYNGGVNMGMATKHSVYLAYDSKSITILKKFGLATKKKPEINETLAPSYFHGTNPENASQILKSGFDPDKSKYQKKLYLTTNYQEASKYSKIANNGKPGIVLKIDSSSLDIKNVVSNYSGIIEYTGKINSKYIKKIGMFGEKRDYKMLTFSEYLLEKECPEITREQMKKFEQFVDKLFARFGIDFDFSTHFIERMSDSRNSPCINIMELGAIFKKIYDTKVKGDERLSKFKDTEAVVKDLQSKLNIPFVIRYDRKNDELKINAKTIMRKADFKTPSPVIAYK
jgi:hypothetical protein